MKQALGIVKPSDPLVLSTSLSPPSEASLLLLSTPDMDISFLWSSLLADIEHFDLWPPAKKINFEPSCGGGG